MSNTKSAIATPVTPPKNATETDGLTSAPRPLPCRGCTQSCQNYDICDGKPWKLFAGREVL